jgi:activator of HSP90 ATPase
MSYDFEVSDIIPGTPGEIYSAWMSSEGHTAMTGAEAHVDPVVGGEFDAWDGYITGRTIELEPGRRIVQSWRTSEFTNEHADSRIEVLFEELDDGTKVTIRHTNVPEGQTGYEQGGWRDSYFEPMRAFFGER